MRFQVASNARPVTAYVRGEGGEAVRHTMSGQGKLPEGVVKKLMEQPIIVAMVEEGSLHFPDHPKAKEIWDTKAAKLKERKLRFDAIRQERIEEAATNADTDAQMEDLKSKAEFLNEENESLKLQMGEMEKKMEAMMTSMEKLQNSGKPEPKTNNDNANANK